MQKHSVSTSGVLSVSMAPPQRRGGFDVAGGGGQGFSNPTILADQVPPQQAEISLSEPQPRNEEEYKSWLKRNYQHYFDNSADKRGIPHAELIKKLESDKNRHRLRQGKLSRLMKEMDSNNDGFISWKEFFDKLTIKRRQDLTKGQKFIIGMIRAASPAVENHKKRNAHAYSLDRLDGEEVEEEYDSYLEAYNCKPPPIFVPISCLAQIICFIVYAVELSKSGDPQNYVTWTSGGTPLYSPLYFDPQRKQEAWRFLSYMLMHSGYHHIVFNLIIQILLGTPLELVHKAWRVGPVFLAGVLGGAVCSAVFDHFTLLVGASGGCYALMGAHVALVVMNWKELQKDWLSFQQEKGLLKFLLSGVMRLIMLTLLICLDFGVALYQRYGLKEDLKTSFLAHIGGLVMGFLVGIPVLKNLDKMPWENYMFWICLIAGVSLMLAGLLYLCVSELLKRY